MEIPKWSKYYLKQERVQLVSEAIKEAESKTSAEIVPMIVRRSSTVGHVPVIVLSVLMLLFLLLEGPTWQADYLGESWLWYILNIVILLLLSSFISRFTFIQRKFTSRSDQQEQVDMRAELEFYESDIKNTKDATGILLFASLMEHRVVVLADKAITDKFTPETWTEICNLLIQGIKKGNIGMAFSNAIKRCGEILEADFPIQPDDKNELHDHLIIKE